MKSENTKGENKVKEDKSSGGKDVNSVNTPIVPIMPKKQQYSHENDNMEKR